MTPTKRDRTGNARALLYRKGQTMFAFVAIDPPYDRPGFEALHQRANCVTGVRAQGFASPFSTGLQIILIEVSQAYLSEEAFVRLILRLLPNYSLTSEWRTDQNDISVALAHLLRQHL